MVEVIQTLQAAWPMLSRAIRSGQLFRPQCKLLEPDSDIACEYDVQVPIGDGVTLTANVFRSIQRQSANAADPVVMCAHPYDNHLTPALGKTPLKGPPKQYRLIPQVEGMPEFSTLTSWEAPDPNFWVPNGYTLVNLNLPGYANSNGQAELVSAKQGRDYYAAIKWVASQGWCDGNVGLAGVSYLAISQYHASAAAYEDGDESPLKCICPWEGISDLYRDLACRGGVTDSGFVNFWWHTEVKETLVEPDDFIRREGGIPAQLLDVHPLFNNYWAEKAVDFSRVHTPMMVCVSFSDHELHTPGSFRAFSEAGSSRKWMYTHRTGKWTSFYSDEVKALTLDFMNHHLKGESNRFNDLKPVRLEVRSNGNEIKAVRWEDTWPLPNADFQKYFLSSNGLTSEQPVEPEVSTYDAQIGKAEFELTFNEDTEVSGHMKLRLWVECQSREDTGEQPNDMVLCVFVEKIDRQGRLIRFNGSVGTKDDPVTRGYMRVSRRALDLQASKDWLPVLRGDLEEPLSSGQIAPVDIALCPSSTFFSTGEKLRLIISPTDIAHAPIFHKDTSLNSGRHVLHFGGEYDAHILLPIIAEKVG